MLSNPKLCIAALSSFGSIKPEPSVSKRLKASRISSISSSVSPGLSKVLRLIGDFWAAAPVFPAPGFYCWAFDII